MKIKKILLIVMAVLICVMCLTACEEEEKPTTSSGGQTSAPSEYASEYENLNEMLEINYSKITITVTEKFDEETSLTSEYVVSHSGETVIVDYVVERFNEISLDNPNTDVKATYKGQAVLENGSSVTLNTGDVVITPNIANVDFKFREEYFENVELTSLYLNADVKDVKSFMNSPSFSCEDMKVYAEFLDSFYKIKVNYAKEDGVQVEYDYQFTL